MYQDFENHKRKDAIKWVAVFLIIAILGVAVAAAITQGFTNANPYGWLDKKQEQEQAETEETTSMFRMLSLANYEENGILLREAEAVTASDNGVSKTLTATVLPADAPDKTVDWTVYWAEDAALKNENISNYLTITPASDGATTATLTCLQPFRGSNAFVKVTTRVGSFNATAVISFEGEPSSISLNTTGLQKGTGVNSFQYIIPVNSTTTIPINLNNVFGDVGSNYYNNFTATLSGAGKITVDTQTVSQAGTNWSGNESQLTLEAIKDSIVNVSISGSNLVISPIKTVENYYTSIHGATMATIYEGKFKSYVAGSAGSAGVKPFFKVLVSRGNINVEFSFVIVSSVESVSLSSTSITF